jgi:hypothetical protein
MVVLDVFIGLILVYFLYSLLVSILAELFSTWIGMRARILRQGIDNFLNDKKPKKEGLMAYLHDIFLIEHLSFRYTNGGKFYEEPSIKYLAKVGENKRWSLKNTKPAYIEKSHFVSAIVSMLLYRSIGINEWDKIKFALDNNSLNLEPETLKMFKGWLEMSNDSYEKFKTHIGNSYAEVNDRLVGWYKRKIGLLLFVIGLVLSFVMNVDTFEMVQILSNNPDARQEMVQLAISTSQTDGTKILTESNTSDSTHNAKVDSAYLSTLSSIDNVSNILGSGWHLENGKTGIFNKAVYIISHSPPWSKKFWGFIITAFALSMGSKFWFDLLKRLVSIRGTGEKPNEHKINKTQTTSDVLIPDNGLNRNTTDPAVVVLSENRRTWEQQLGFVAANIRYEKNNVGFIQLVFGKGRDIDNMPSSIPNPINPKDAPVKLAYEIGAKGSFGQDPSGPLNGAVIQSFTNNWGTPTGVVFDKRTNKHAILTCAHVIRNDKTAFIDDSKSNVFYKHPDSADPVLIGNSKNMVLSSFCDAGVISVKDNLPIKLEGLTPLDKLREVTSADEFRTIVNIHTLRKDPSDTTKPLNLKGKIISSRESYGFDDHPSSDIRFYDLFMIGDADGDNTKAMTFPGDSGSLITDENNNQLGVLVGTVMINGNHFSYGIKLKDVFEILQLDPIKNEQKTIPFA